MVEAREFLEVTPEFCPQAVIDWSDAIPTSDFTGSDCKKKAKGHLSALGWTFWYFKKQNRLELRYREPSGKSHNSFRTACRACIASGGASLTAAVASGDGRGGLVPENVESFVVNMPNGESLIRSPKFSISNSCSDPAAAMPTTRKRKLDFEALPGGSMNSGLREFDGENLDLHVDRPVVTLESSMVDAEPGCSSIPRRCGKVAVDLEGLRDQSKIDGRKGTKKPDRNNNKRAKKATKIVRRQNRNTSLGGLIDSNVVNVGAKVSYRGKPGTGVITREGIRCDCCSLFFSLTTFENHLGSTNHRPATNIILEDGRSLADCKNSLYNSGAKTTTMKSGARKTHVQNVDPLKDGDDICGVCQYGGELVLCDRCPSAYHPVCLGFQTLPEGDWFCPSCRCGVCGNGNLEREGECDGGDVIVVCDQCERKFHVGCLTDSRSGGLDEKRFFCCRKCEDVCQGLSELVGKKIPVSEDGLTWTLLKSGENDPRLVTALSVMHQCFKPAIDPLTHRDIVQDVIYGRKSKLSRLNYEGFYLVLLEKEAELITVAALRVHGIDLAEVPLVATKFEHRRHGMCHILMGEVEKQMLDLGVKKLILPAATCVVQTWVNSFGFSVLSVDEKLEFMRYNPLDFQETFMCQKLLVKKTTGTSEAKSSPLMQDFAACETSFCSLYEQRWFESED